MKTHQAIRKNLKALGINKAIAGDTTYDGTPVVLVRWNGQEEHVSATHFALGAYDIPNESDFEYIEWITQTYADTNLHG